MRRSRQLLQRLSCIGLVLMLGACATQKESDGAPDPETLGITERVQHYKEAVKTSPDNPEYHYRLGNAQLDMGLFQDAYHAYQRAIQLKPDYADAYANLGLALRKMGNLKAAAGAYVSALDINPDDRVTLGNLSVVAQLMEDWERALWCYERLVALDPEDNGLLSAYADLLGRFGRPAEAAPLFERLAAKQVDPARSLYRAGLCYFDMAQFDRAVAAWEKARAIDPENASINRGLAVAYWEAGDSAGTNAAIARCEKLGIALDPAFLAQVGASR